MFKYILLLATVTITAACAEPSINDQSVNSLQKNEQPVGTDARPPMDFAEQPDFIKPEFVNRTIPGKNVCSYRFLKTWAGNSQLIGKKFVNEKTKSSDTVNLTQIKSQFKCDLTVRVLPHNGQATTDFSESRINVYLDKQQRVSRFSVG